MDLDAWLKELKYDASGLIPAVIQDYFTGQVLMLGYMNAESLRISMKEGRTCFYSVRASRSGARGRPAATYSASFPSRRTATWIRW